MIWLKILNKIFKILHSNDSPRQIAWGVACGVFLGFFPIMSPQWFIFFLFILIINVNLGAALLSVALFKAISLTLCLPAHKIGSILLIDMSQFKPLWTKLYNIPLIPFTKFNNTVVLGNFVLSLILFIPVFFIFLKLIEYYRSNIMNNIEKYKIIKMLKTSKIYNLYKKIMLLKDN